jgi:hypothetical protein
MTFLYKHNSVDQIKQNEIGGGMWHVWARVQVLQGFGGET